MKRRASKFVNACAAAAVSSKSTRLIVDASVKPGLRHEFDGRGNEGLPPTQRHPQVPRPLLSNRPRKNEALAAKDAVIAGQDKLVNELRRRKTSPWKRLGDVLIGVAAAAILK